MPPAPAGRGKTIGLRTLRREQAGTAPGAPPHARPQTRADCLDGPRPCPFIGCRYHLALDAKRTALRLPFGEELEDLDALEYTCALDAADDGTRTGVEVANLLGISRQRVAQVELEALTKLKKQFEKLGPDMLEKLLPTLRQMLARQRLDMRDVDE